MIFGWWICEIAAALEARIEAFSGFLLQTLLVALGQSTMFTGHTVAVFITWHIRIGGRIWVLLASFQRFGPKAL